MTSPLPSLAYLIRCIFLIACTAPLAGAGGVQILGRPELGTPTSLQLAVDLAEDGDHLLVGPGVYGGFSVEGKSLVILVPTPGSVSVQGTVAVRALDWRQTVVLSGLHATGAGLHPKSAPGLRLENNRGHVRIQDCTFEGGTGVEGTDCLEWGNGGIGADLDDNTRVAFARCTLKGGVGYGEQNNNNYECLGGNGGKGLLTRDSAVALYDCTVTGAPGGAGQQEGGNGGDGCRVETFGVQASGTLFTGGDGGGGWDSVGSGGDGGDALSVDVVAQAQLLDCSFVRGAPGFGIAVQGMGGTTYTGGGVIKFHAGDARVFTATSAPGGWVAGGNLVSMTASGSPGDRVFLAQSAHPDWFVPQPKTGVWLVPKPQYLPWPPLATVSSGPAAFKLGGNGVGGGAPARTRFLQGYVLDASGTGVLGSPLVLTTLNRSALPDCNGNGVFDVLDVLEGTSADLDGNLIPDECDSDCNANGTLDGLEILAAPSLDLDGNGVLDECQYGGPTWFVDAQAVGAGEGSAALPYRGLASAFARASGGQTIVVAGGTYSGASNRELDFAGRNLTVVGAGPAATELDCGGYGRAFVLDSGEGPGARIEGLTITNGDCSDSPLQPGYGGAICALNAQPTVSSCSLEDCSATYGGALAAQSGRFEDLLMERCAASQDGGGLYVFSGPPVPSPVLRRSIVRDCTAGEGGAVYVRAFASGAVVSHCRLEQNHATVEGGGLYFSTLNGFSLDNCLVAGNGSDGSGGGASLAGGDVTNSLFVGNHAALAGGAFTTSNSTRLSILNSIVWDSSQGSGAAIEHLGNGDLRVARSDVEGGLAAVSGPGVVMWFNNLELDPLFVDPLGPDGDPLTFLDNDYRLGAGSPCIDAAGNGNVPLDLADIDDDGDLTEVVPLDLDLATRFVDDPAAPDTGGGTAPIVDMGPYERAP